MLNTTDRNTASSSAADQQPDPARVRRQHADQALTQIVTTALLVAIAFGAGWFGNSYVNRDRYISNPNELIIHQAWNDINKNFVVTSNINQKQMAYAAVNGMIGTLNDPGHTVFLTPEQYSSETASLNGQAQIGLGVELSGGDGKTPLKVLVVFPGSSADKAGVKPGDEFAAINGTDVTHQTSDQVRQLIAQQGTRTFTLTMFRPSLKKTITFSLARGPYTVPTVATYYLPQQNLADIQLFQFSDRSSVDLQKALTDAINNHHAKGIIFDLRGNPGGLLQEAINVVSEFLPYSASNPDKVLIVKSRTSSSTYTVSDAAEQSAQGQSVVIDKGLAANTPVAILVDSGTASAAEITTGAIHINRPDVHVIGQTTYGTGTVLQTYIFGDGSALVLGTQEFLLPNGASIYHKGYTPDQPVALPNTVQPLTPLVASEDNLTYAQVQKSGDAQLLTAISDLSGGQ
ncbi:MAG: S41 family peptidase [Ktedonobacterales bacterium]